MDVVSMGLIRDLAVSAENTVSFEFRPSSFVCPLAFPLALEIQEKVRNIPEVKGVTITVKEYQKAEELNRLLVQVSV